MVSLLLKNGRVIDPSQGLDEVTSVVVRGGRIVSIGADESDVDQKIDATGLLVVPGLIDLHVGLRDPGFEEDETTSTGTAAALAGGFTSIAAYPDTQPVVDNRASAEYVVLQAKRAQQTRVYPLGAVTRDHAGQELADIGQLVDGGAVAFTDAKTPLQSAEIMRRALEYTRMFRRPIFSCPQDTTLSAGGIMHEGYHSTLLGLRGIPAAAEEIMVDRDVALAELTGGHVHLMCLSTANAVEEVRRAKQRGIRVTADVTPHHLLLTDDALQTYDANYKVSPPLRTREHQEALLEGLRDGTIDAISSDHQPYAAEKKVRELDQVPFGIVGLETALPLAVKALLEPGLVDWPQLIGLLSTKPARILGLPAGTLRPGTEADVTVIDPNAQWVIDPARFQSRGRNTPFAGWSVRGRAAMTIVGGTVRYCHLDYGNRLRKRAV